MAREVHAQWAPSSSVGKSEASDRQLSLKLEPELLRGVPLHEGLSGWGQHWETPDSGMFKVDPKNYQLSRVTTFYDAFLSHDWASSRWLKLLSLLIIFNSRAAFFSSLVISILVGFLRAYGILPNQQWTAVFGHFTFLLVSRA